MDNLDELTNDQIRLRLNEFGFANLPVTATTRKVLVKKLRNAIEGQNTKTRRETIHVTKYSSDEDAGADSAVNKSKVIKKLAESSRRATIAVQAIDTAATKKHQSPAPASVKTRRASSARQQTPVKEDQPAIVAQTRPVSTVPEIVEDSDEDVVMVKVTRGNRSSRSPSLAKVNVLVPPTKKTEHTIQHPEIMEVDEEFETSADVEVSQYLSPRATTPKKNMPIKATPPRAAPLSRNVNPTKGLEADILESRRKTIANTSNYSESAVYTTTTSNRPSYNPYSSKPSTSAYTSHYKTSLAASDSDNDEDADDYDTESNVPKIETPYLSNFTRRLSRLQAEPLTGGTPRLLRDSPIRDYYRTSEPISRQSQRDESIWGSFKTLIVAFEKKYRWILLSIIGLLFSIFVYVMFFTE